MSSHTSETAITIQEWYLDKLELHVCQGCSVPLICIPFFNENIPPTKCSYHATFIPNNPSAMTKTRLHKKRKGLIQRDTKIWEIPNVRCWRQGITHKNEPWILDPSRSTAYFGALPNEHYWKVSGYKYLLKISQITAHS